MEACLASLRTLNYPDYEVVVVNDGSTDQTGAITRRFEALYAAQPDGPRMVVIDQPNRGLSVARNVGAEAASGEIVAYTDSDCVPDPDWLTFLSTRSWRRLRRRRGPKFRPVAGLVPRRWRCRPAADPAPELRCVGAVRLQMAFTKQALR